MRLSDEQIGAELRALRPTPREGFIAKLDEQIAALPTQPESPRWSSAFRTDAPARRRPMQWKRLIPAFAALAVAVTVIAVALSNRDFENQSPTSPGDQSKPSLGAGGAAPQKSVAPTAAQPVPPIPNEQLKPGRERVQERSASLGLSTDPSKVQDVSDGVVDVTDRYDGIVASSQVSTGGGNGRASFDLRIPTQNLQAALADL